VNISCGEHYLIISGQSSLFLEVGFSLALKALPALSAEPRYAATTSTVEKKLPDFWHI
jgi:hypothetical protein